MKSNNKYNLLTCIAMIVGVVIGSGIFFKSDNILVATNGNILLGAVAFCIAAISIIFGSLALAELASRTDKTGGVISYTEEAYNSSSACALGWFCALIYYPTSVVVVAFVVGIYSCMLFGINGTLELQLIIGTITILVIFIVNTLSAKLAGYFQTAATFIKLIPLFLIGIAGFIFGDPVSAAQTSVETMSSSSGWLTALVPIVFAFDGWLVATAISHNVENAKRNVPIALIVSPIIILAMYLLYFVGISIYVGPDTIMAAGDSHVELAATQLLGPWAAKGILVFVIISVAATANGLTIALFQLPYSLALRGMCPASDKLSKVNEKWQTPILSYLVGTVILFVWIAIHYFTQKYNVFGNSDVSEIGVTLNYLLLIPLYYHVLRLGQKGEIKGIWRGKITPILAICGSLIILIVGMQSSLFVVYLAICAIVLITAYYYYQRKINKDEDDDDNLCLESLAE